MKSFFQYLFSILLITLVAALGVLVTWPSAISKTWVISSSVAGFVASFYYGVPIGTIVVVSFTWPLMISFLFALILTCVKIYCEHRTYRPQPAHQPFT